MDYFNPFIRNTQIAPTQPQPQRVDPQQFRQFAITLNDNALANFAQMARQQGISEADIQNGIRFIKSL